MNNLFFWQVLAAVESDEESQKDQIQLNQMKQKPDEYKLKVHEMNMTEHNEEAVVYKSRINKDTVKWLKITDTWGVTLLYVHNSVACMIP